MKEKKKSTLSKLMVFAGNHKYYVYASCILADYKCIHGFSSFL